MGWSDPVVRYGEDEKFIELAKAESCRSESVAAKPQKTDYTRRSSFGNVSGRGFDSPRLQSSLRARAMSEGCRVGM